MFFQCLSENKDVVQVYYHNTLCNKIPKNVVYHGLEDGWAIDYTKEHYKGFKKTAVHAKRSLPLITRLNVDIVEFLAHV